MTVLLFLLTSSGSPNVLPRQFGVFDIPANGVFGLFSWHTADVFPPVGGLTVCMVMRCPGYDRSSQRQAFPREASRCPFTVLLAVWCHRGVTMSHLLPGSTKSREALVFYFLLLPFLSFNSFFILCLSYFQNITNFQNYIQFSKL
jgi:hypothetical protein